MITEQGYQLKRMPEIIDELRASFRAVFGENIDLRGNAPLGQIIGIFAESEALLREEIQDLYNSQYPNTASGRPLDNAVSITGTRRKPATFSRVIRGIARGATGTVVPAGTIIGVEGSENAQFVTQSEATINIADGDTFKSGPIELVASSSGPVAAMAGTLTNIITPTAGLNAFTNEDNAVLGEDLETDAQIKNRRIEELNLAGVATEEAIKSRLRARTNVEAVQTFVNDSAIEINGRPPHSIEILVKGDDDALLAQAIFDLVGAGITYFGTTLQTITDSQGNQQKIRFSRPVEVPIFVDFAIKTNADYPVDGDNQIKQAIINWGEDSTIGQNIVLFGSNSLACVIDNIPGIIGLTITVGRAADALAANNLQISPSEIATFDLANITITKT